MIMLNMLTMRYLGCCLPKTVMLNVQLSIFLAKSVATHLTIDSPIGKALPFVGAHFIVGGYPELSVAVVFHSTTAVGDPRSVYLVKLPEQVIFGVSLSETF